MNITNKDLELLQKIEIELWNTKNTKLYFELWRFNEKLLTQKEEKNKKAAAKMREARKTNKYYGRSKKEIEASERAKAKRELKNEKRKN